jgi:hypothetical protein
MVEQAFRVLPSADLYNTYFAAEEEKNKFHQLARAFFAKYEFIDDGVNTGYYMNEDLHVQLCEADRERFVSQLKKFIDKNEICYFKKSSKMNKAWHSEVSGQCDLRKLDGTWCWYFPYIGKGKYTLWNDGESLYGYLMDENKDYIQLADWMYPIKMSEYYAIQEAIEERKNESD